MLCTLAAIVAHYGLEKPVERWLRNRMPGRRHDNDRQERPLGYPLGFMCRSRKAMTPSIARSWIWPGPGAPPAADGKR